VERVDEELFPDTFQTSFGRDLIGDWVLGEDSDGNSLLSPLDDLAEEEDWSSVFPRGLLDAVSYDGHMYAVPVNIHRTNVAFYNIRVLEDNDLEFPTTMDGLFDLAEVLSNLEDPITPIAVGSNGAWTITLLTFENVFVSHAGVDGYLDFFSGRTGADYAPMQAALEDLLRLSQYFNEDRDLLEWDQAVGLVERGSAAMNVMGDWAKGNLESRGAVPDEDFGAAPFPGTSNAFIFGGDCFPLMAGAPNPEATRELLRTFGSRVGQDAFNPIKGSIPARTDADIDLYDSMAVRAIADFGDAQTAPGLAALVPSSFGSAVTNAFPEMLSSQDIQVMLDVIRDNYDSLGE
jgi:glucose/mannose transport system substrate-binding protein